jgi:hypothetical protein
MRVKRYGASDGRRQASEGRKSSCGYFVRHEALQFLVKVLNDDEVALGSGLIADHVLDHQEVSAIRVNVVCATEVGLACAV